jgi:tetrapyrrole methylase family protein/MazG family protein
MLKDKQTLLSEEKHDFDSLVSIMDILRSDEGCPWDREQTHESIRKCLIEETYEVVEAIDNDDAVLMREELGDLIFQAVFHAKIESERNNFDIYDSVNDICQKMINRHPHVFADKTVSAADAVVLNWDQIKKEEKKQKSISESLRNVPPYLPALLKAQKVHDKARKKLDIGFSTKEEALDFVRRNIDKSIAQCVFALAAAASFDGTDMEKSLNDVIDLFTSQCEKAEFSENATF